ncbi:MAG: CopD family protein [Burkholderiaceae bacterium]
MQGTWLFLHLLGAITWLGGMFFVLYCLRPALPVLEPPMRAPLMVSALGRFFNYVSIAVVIIWLSGFMLLAPVGLKNAPSGWQIMMGAAAIMTILFVVIRLMLFPSVRRAVNEGELPRAASGLNAIRWLVVLNLLLGLVAVAGVSLLR